MNTSDASEKTQWRTLAGLIPFIRPYGGWLALTVLAHAVERISTQIVSPYLLQRMTDGVVRGGLQAMTPWLLVGAGLLVTNAAFAYAGQRAGARTTASTLRDLRDRVTAHLQQVPLGYLESQGTGDLVSRLSTDVSKIEAWLPMVREVVVQPLIFIVGVAYMLTISWKLFLASSVLIPVSALLYNRVSRPMETLARRQAESEGRVNAALQNMLAGIVAVKAFNLQPLLGARFRTLAKEVERQALRLDWRRALFIAVYLALRYIPQLVVPLYGGSLAFQGEITVGELLAANLVVWMVFLPIERLLDFFGRTRETLPAVARLTGILDVAPEPQGSGSLIPAPGAPLIRFQAVAFAYDGGEPLLREISFDVNPGETVALVGASGCGKSTLLKLLCGFYHPQQGTIEIAGNALTAVALNAARAQIALMTQETYLFPTTITENIAYGRRDATDAEIIAAARAANAHDFILAQPAGYETLVGERGANLSGGERQRIALARAILKDAPILLLDEPTASLDAQSEALIQEALARFMDERTGVIVAHRLSTLQHVDRILVLDDPEGDGSATICETGTHAELMARPSRYRQLYLKQSAELTPTEGGGR